MDVEGCDGGHEAELNELDGGGWGWEVATLRDAVLSRKVESGEFPFPTTVDLSILSKYLLCT